MPTAVEYFLKIDGVEGESLDDKHKGEIDVESWSWGETQTGSFSFAGGAGAGKVQMQDFHFAMHMSKASPKLFLACASGQHIKFATLNGVRGGDLAFNFMKWHLSDVLISSYQTGGAAGDSLPTDQLSMKFAKIEIVYTVQTASGAPGEQVKAGWDLRLNQKV
jgi:type VI secretion system secreted protein Hcp